MFDILLEASLRAMLIAALVLGALWSLRVRAAAVRHRAWTVVVVAMLGLPFAIAFAPDLSVQVPAYSQASDAHAKPARAVDVAATALEPTTDLKPQPTASFDWQTWLLAVYFAGAATMLARLGIGTLRIRRLAREATVIDGILTSKRIATPFTFGLLAPKVLLPADWQQWSATQLALVLDHEQSHVARRDPLVQWLALLNRAVFWFHPLAWWLERRLADLAEEACDAEVLARGHSATEYSEQLLALARLASRRPLPSLVNAQMPGSALPTRIVKILDGEARRSGSRAAGAAAALATTAAALLGTVTLAQETEGPRNLVDVYELAVDDKEPAVRNESARQALLVDVAKLYFDVLASERAVALQTSARDAFSRHLEQAQRRFEVGLIGITEVQEAQGDVDRASANALAAQAALAAAQQAFHEVVGAVGQIEPLAEDLPLTAPPDPGNQASPEVRAAYLDVVSELSRALALKQAVQSSETAFKATSVGFEVGIRTSLDVMRAQNILSQSETDYARSRDAYALNMLRLERAAGGLTSRRLEDLGRWFQ